MHFCRYFHDDHLPEPVRARLESSLYESFAGEPSREQLDDPTEEVQIAAALDATVRRLCATVTFGAVTRGNPRLSERISHEAVHWLGDRWHELESDDPFAEEEHDLELARESRDGVKRKDLIRRRRPALGALAELAVTSGNGGQEDEVQRLRSAAREEELFSQWEHRLTGERSAYRTRELGRALGSFVRELGRIVPRLARQQRAVQDALGNDNALWDLSMHEWEELPAGGLEEGARTLAERPELRELASVLGRSKAVSERQTVQREQRRVRLRPVGIGKSEVTGIRWGDDLSSLIPSEVALLAEPETAELFYAKLAAKQLSVLEYNRQKLVEQEERRLVSTQEEILVRRGPVIVCVDTSGSMFGFPERIAKATVLALAGTLVEHRRDLQVLAFSSQVRSFSLSYTTGGAPDLPALTQFLGGGFHGGTDLHKALHSAIQLLEERTLRHADVLVISDFRVPKIADRYVARIKRAHQNGTLFHSLTVAERPVIDPLHIFDSAWLVSTATGRIDERTLRRV